jgi:hypothetical protein
VLGDTIFRSRVAAVVGVVGAGLEVSLCNGMAHADGCNWGIALFPAPRTTLKRGD